MIFFIYFLNVAFLWEFIHKKIIYYVSTFQEAKTYYSYWNIGSPDLFEDFWRKKSSFLEKFHGLKYCRAIFTISGPRNRNSGSRNCTTMSCHMFISINRQIQDNGENSHSKESFLKSYDKIKTKKKAIFIYKSALLDILLHFPQLHEKILIIFLATSYCQYTVTIVTYANSIDVLHWDDNWAWLLGAHPKVMVKLTKTIVIYLSQNKKWICWYTPYQTWPPKACFLSSYRLAQSNLSDKSH